MGGGMTPSWGRGLPHPSILGTPVSLKRNISEQKILNAVKIKPKITNFAKISFSKNALLNENSFKSPEK